MSGKKRLFLGSALCLISSQLLACTETPTANDTSSRQHGDPRDSSAHSVPAEAGVANMKDEATDADSTALTPGSATSDGQSTTSDAKTPATGEVTEAGTNDPGATGAGCDGGACDADLAGEVCDDYQTCAGSVGYSCPDFDWDDDATWQLDTNIICPQLTNTQCEDVDAQLKQLAGEGTCSKDSDCRILSDWKGCDCSPTVGEFAYSTDVDAAVLRALFDQLVFGGCGEGVCDMAPQDVACVEQRCTLVGPESCLSDREDDDAGAD